MENDSGSAAPLCAVIIFDHAAAYRRALRALVSLDRVVEGGLHVRLFPWRLEEIDSGDHPPLAAKHIREAAVIVVSLTSAVAPPLALRECLLERGPRRDGRRPLLVVSLLGESAHLDAATSPRYQFIKRTADEAGCDFLAPRQARREFSATLSEAAFAP